MQVGDYVFSITKPFIINVQKSRLRQELSRTKHMLSNVFSAVNKSSIISSTDKNGTITFVNDNFEKISGYQKDELLGQPHSIINSGHHPKSFWSNVWKTIAKGEIWRGEVCNRAKDGRLYWVDTFIYPCYDENHNFIEYFSIRNDITNRKQQEEALSRSASLLRSIFSSTSDIYILLNREQEIVTFNQQAEQLVYSNNDKERAIETFLQIQPKFSECFQIALNGNSCETEQLLSMLDGSSQWYQIRCMPAYKSHGEIIGVSVNLINIHTKKLHEINLVRQNNTLTEIARMQSHDIRRPVTSILGLLYLLEMEDKQLQDAEMLRHLKTMALELDEKTKRIVQMTNESEVTLQ